MITERIVPVFQVSNLEAALKYYREVFGFSEDFRFGNYAGVKLGTIDIHLTEQSQDSRTEYRKPIGSGIAYIFCDEIDSYCAALKKKGANLKYEPTDFPYGMREFMVVDLCGNHLAFGAEIKTA